MSTLPEAVGLRSMYRFSADGVSFDITPIKMRTAAKLQHWLGQQEKPYALAKAKADVEGLPESVASEILQDAAARDRAWPPSVCLEHGAALVAFMSIEGGPEELAYQLMRQCAPSSLPDAKVRELAQNLDHDTFLKIVSAAFGTSESAPLDRSNPEVYITTRPMLARLLSAGCNAMKESPELDIEAFVQALDLSLFGFVIPVRLVGGEVELPKGKAQAGQSRRSTSAKPTD